MSTWFGNLGALHDITCPAKQSRTGGINHTTWELAAGGRHAQVNVARRAWALDTTGAVTPEALAALEAHFYGAFGPGPFHFVPPDAVATNLVTPWDSLMGSSAPLAFANPANSAWYAGAGGATMPDGTIVPGSLQRIAVPPSPQRIRLTDKPIPCPPGGGKMTISGWIAGTPGNAAHFLPGWADSNGTVVAYGTSTPGVTSTVPQRVSVTVDTGNYPGLHLYGESYAILMAGIAVTWTDEVYPFAVGRGCASAVVEPASLDTVLAVAGTKGWGRYDTSSYQVTEIG